MEVQPLNRRIFFQAAGQLRRETVLHQIAPSRRVYTDHRRKTIRNGVAGRVYGFHFWYSVWRLCMAFRAKKAFCVELYYWLQKTELRAATGL